MFREKKEIKKFNLKWNCFSITLLLIERWQKAKRNGISIFLHFSNNLNYGIVLNACVLLQVQCNCSLRLP